MAREERALQDALRRAIATRRGSCPGAVECAGCKGVVILHSAEEQGTSGKSLTADLAWRLV